MPDPIPVAEVNVKPVRTVTALPDGQGIGENWRVLLIPPDDSAVVAYLGTVQQVRHAIAPKALVRTVSPLGGVGPDGTLELPAAGVEGQMYWFNQPNNAGVLYHWVDTSWVVVHRWGPTTIGKGQSDNLPPTGKITFSKNPAVVGDQVIISIAAADSDGEVVSVQLFNGTELMAPVPDSPYLYKYVPQNTGTFSFTAKISDNDGAVTITELARLNVGKEVVTNITPAAPTGGEVNDNLNTFDFVRNPLYPTNVDYEQTLDGGLNWTALVAKPIEVGNVAKLKGVVGVRVKAATGRNFSLGVFNAQPFTVTTALPNQGPVVTAFSRTPTGNLTSGQTVAFTGAGTDPDGSVASLRVKESGVVVVTITGASGTSGSITPAVGSHTYSLHAVDNQGMEGAAFATTLTVVVEAAVVTPPTLAYPLTGPGPAAHPSDGTQLTASAGDLFKYNPKALGASDAKVMYVYLPDGTTQVAAVDFLTPYVGDLFSFQVGGAGTVYYGRFKDYEQGNVTLSTNFNI